MNQHIGVVIIEPELLRFFFFLQLIWADCVNWSDKSTPNYNGTFFLPKKKQSSWLKPFICTCFVHTLFSFVLSIWRSARILFFFNWCEMTFALNLLGWREGPITHSWLIATLCAITELHLIDAIKIKAHAQPKIKTHANKSQLIQFHFFFIHFFVQNVLLYCSTCSNNNNNDNSSSVIPSSMGVCLLSIAHTDRDNAYCLLRRSVGFLQTWCHNFWIIDLNSQFK